MFSLVSKLFVVCKFRDGNEILNEPYEQELPSIVELDETESASKR